MSDELIPDDEVLYRRIPPGEQHFEPPDRITSANFKLHKKEDGTKEEGLSVYRASIVRPAEVLNKPDATPGSRLAEATAGEVRDLRSGKGEPLNLRVLPVDDEDDSGHSEIRGPEPRRLSSSASKALRDLFKLVPTE